MSKNPPYAELKIRFDADEFLINDPKSETKLSHQVNTFAEDLLEFIKKYPFENLRVALQEDDFN